ncbi:MAG TPA: hypothetical protein DCQ64_23870 [Candidatus Rokubacteria bacterium]|nr:hypothetical protein [Candidatus Rokubacteria bacterium]
MNGLRKRILSRLFIPNSPRPGPNTECEFVERHQPPRQPRKAQRRSPRVTLIADTALEVGGDEYAFSDQEIDEIHALLERCDMLDRRDEIILALADQMAQMASSLDK